MFFKRRRPHSKRVNLGNENCYSLHISTSDATICDEKQGLHRATVGIPSASNAVQAVLLLQIFIISFSNKEETHESKKTIFDML